MMGTELEKKTLREWREEAGLTQAELAELAGCSKSTVSDLELGNTSPTSFSGIKIATVLGLTVEQVLIPTPKNGVRNAISMPDPPFNPPRQTLEWWRTYYSLTQRELARLSGLGSAVVQHIERGTHKNTAPRTRRKLAQALGIPPDKLILPGDDAIPEQEKSEMDFLRAELRGARRALRKAHDFLRHDPNIAMRALDNRDAILPDIEKEVRGL